jgi:cell division protein ZapA
MKTKKIGKHHVTKEKEIIDTETGELLVKSEKTLAVQTELEKCPNTKEIFESNQFKEDVKQELENSHPELAERFDQDVELPSYNVISEELFLKKEFIKGQAEKIAELEKLLDLSDKFYKQSEYNESKTKEKLAKVEQELEKANQKIAALEETNNQLFSANENLTKELNEIKQKNVDLENRLDEVRLINSNIIELEKNNKNLKDRIDTLIKENETLKEANGRLKFVVKPSNSNQSDEMLVKIQSIFEASLEKGKEKREGIRIGRTNSIELLTAIKQTLGVE